MNHVNHPGIHSFATQVWVSTRIKLDKVTKLQGQTGTLITTIAEEVFENTKQMAATCRGQDRETFDRGSRQAVSASAHSGECVLAKGLQQIQDLGVPLRSFHFSTTHNQLSLGATLSTTGLESPLAPAPQLMLPFDLAARVHQFAS